MTSDQDEFANIINTCLDLTLSGEATMDEILARYPEHAEELRSILGTALWFNQQKQIFDASPGSMSAQKIRLQEKLSTHPQKALRPFNWGDLLAQFRTFLSPRTFQLAGSLALVIILLFSSSAGFALAAKNSIPGDLLYQPKLSLEKAALFLSRSEIHDTELQVEYTNRRMVEVEAVIQGDRLGYLPASIQRFNQQVELTLAEINIDTQTPQAEKARLAGQLIETLESHSILINALATSLPEQYQDDVSLAISVTQESLSKATDIISQPIDNQPSPINPVADQPTTTWTPTASAPLTATTLPGGSSSATPFITNTPSATPLPLVLPGVSPTPTPTPTPTMTLSDDPNLPKAVPTRKPTKTSKPTKTPKIKPTRNPHYTEPAG